MAKGFIGLVILITVLLFITGCTPVKPEPIETPNAKPADIKPAKTEPPKAESGTTASFHDKCVDILKTYVNEKGMVDYKMLKRRKLELKELLNEFARLKVNEYNRWSKADKIAFWINAYNLQMLKIIVDNYPIKSSRILRVFWGPNSIRHIDKRIGGIDRQKFIVMDEEFTLAEVKQRIFRRQFDEPRIFFAISNASYSSGPLRNEPYYGDRLDKQLDEQVKRFLSSPLALQIDRDGYSVYLSAMFEAGWFGREFISKYGTDKKFKDQEPATRAVLNFLTSYISKQDVFFLERKNYSVKYIKYDWTLNE